MAGREGGGRWDEERGQRWRGCGGGGDGGRREATGDGGCGWRELGLGLGRIAACYIQWKRDQSHQFIDEWPKIVGPFRAETGLIHLYTA
jgi:hypothetical protein